MFSYNVSLTTTPYNGSLTTTPYNMSLTTTPYNVSLTTTPYNMFIRRRFIIYFLKVCEFESSPAQPTVVRVGGLYNATSGRFFDELYRATNGRSFLWIISHYQRTFLRWIIWRYQRTFLSVDYTAHRRQWFYLYSHVFLQWSGFSMFLPGIERDFRSFPLSFISFLVLFYRLIVIHVQLLRIVN